ncbi:MAG TPA: pantoate--beta-alanine ligase [Xanthobacteraceae bacterium]|jgi:pantoate--beta-alanine ligase|nr:pantoate--beta-alanine ligase [Xanthobacteraceae bacterium]
MNRKNSINRPRVIKTLSPLKRAVGEFHKRGKTLALVPTMGALHAGHLALIRVAQRRADRVIVSIFVNPTQFAPTEDLSTYPQTFASDLAALAKMKADLVWAPSVETMYPEGFATRIMPEGPAKAGLEDAFRPHFFAGVATVVAKLFIQCEADFALFGEKDYQQLKVVTQMARDLVLRTRVVGVPTVREKDGLALSSRNIYLSPAERDTAPILNRTLKECAAAIRAGKPVANVLAAGGKAITRAGFALDYIEARNADTLAPLVAAKVEPIRLLVAAKIGKTRLIDNIGV